MTRALVILAAHGLLVTPSDLAAQGYRVRLDTRVQTVAVRGVTLDSIPASQALPDPDGGFFTPDGIAARCPTGLAFCTFFRPGPELRGGPLVTTADVSVWGLGVPGLVVRGTIRAGVDLGDSDAWPGTDPAVHLLEGYAEYSTRHVTARVGRTSVFTRLGFTGFDGGRVELRPVRAVRVLAYGGWGLARGVALPVTSEALNPLDDFQPRDRQLIAGVRLGWSVQPFEGTALYQREVDPGSNLFVTERIAFDGAARIIEGLTLAGGADYDVSFDEWGTVDGRIVYAEPGGLVQLSAGARRYRPHFDLWTIWGAFSPTPYSAVFGAGSVWPLAGVELRARGEAYRFDDTAAETALARFESNGWRWSWSATVSRFTPWTVYGDYYADFGPGAASRGFDGGVSVRPIDRLTATARFGILRRPLEFRFDDAKVWTYAVRVDYRPAANVGFMVEMQRFDETRRRPDTARLNWDQLRVNAGLTLTFGTGVDHGGLHPAILRIPDVPRGR